MIVVSINSQPDTKYLLLYCDPFLCKRLKLWMDGRSDISKVTTVFFEQQPFHSEIFGALKTASSSLSGSVAVREGGWETKISRATSDFEHLGIRK